MHAISFDKIISNARSYWPMHIAEGNSDIGFRIGGVPPIGVKPKLTTERTRYFGTFPVLGGQDRELSIFLSFDYMDLNSPFFIARHIHKPIDDDSRVIQFVCHAPVRRGGESDLASDLNAYTVKVGTESLDDAEDAKRGVPHKIGGIPFLYPKFRETLDSLLGNGYYHFLQWAFPGKGDCAVKGQWPFADYLFHLFVKQSRAGFNYKSLLV